jgi:hypothetical protein
MMTTIIPRLVAGVLLSLVLGGAPVWAQISVAPQGLSVSVPQHGAEVRTVTLTNVGDEALAFCLSFDRPLQRMEGTLSLASDAAGGAACGPYGDAFTRIDEEDLPPSLSWSPYGMTATPDGRLFVADYNGGPAETYELTVDLTFVRSFAHPTVAERTPFAATVGVAYRSRAGASEKSRLWWMNSEESGFAVERAMLLEGNLDGVPTGRRVEVPVAQTAPPPTKSGFPVGLAYDGASARFYYLDIANDDLWAVNTLGALADGYPVDPVFPYGQLGFGLDAHRGIDRDASSDEGVWLEVGTALPNDTRVTRIVALNADGSWDGIETPVPEGPSGEVMSGAPVRSRVDPNGAMYYPAATFGVEAVFAVRPHPLPPTWLVVGEREEGEGPEDAWNGVLAPGESRDVALTFRAGGREVGAYEAALQVFEAATGAAVEVPLSMTVTPGTDTESEPEPALASGLSVYPNPSAGAATVTLTLAEAEEVRVAVYDVLGRTVAVLHEGALAAGSNELRLDGAGLPPGVYIVRAEGEAFRVTRRVTLLR